MAYGTEGWGRVKNLALLSVIWLNCYPVCGDTLLLTHSEDKALKFLLEKVYITCDYIVGTQNIPNDRHSF